MPRKTKKEITSMSLTGNPETKVPALVPALAPAPVPVPAPTPVEILDTVKMSERLDKATTYIKKEIGGVAKSFCKIGFKLWEIRENKLYLGKGYKNVYEYGENVLRLQKSSIASYIAVCERFSLRDSSENPTAKLVESFSDYSYGQLALMLSLPENKIPEIKPDTTCKKIREIKKTIKDASNPSASTTSPANPALDTTSSGDAETPINPAPASAPSGNSEPPTTPAPTPAPNLTGEPEKFCGLLWSGFLKKGRYCPCR